MSTVVNNDDAEPVRASRANRLIPPLLIGTGMAALAFGGLWLARAPIAENLIERELAARNVRMTYRIASIGPRTQRIEDIVLGDPGHPDLTAQWVEVDIALAGFSPGISAIRAGGVRLNAVVQDGTLSMGELDKFMGEGGSTRTTLPDVRLDLADARASVVTDYGPLGIVLDSRGNLRNGFDV